jgi:hypothetical protein
MTLQKTIAPLVLLMFTAVFALPAAPAAVIPSAIAQEEDEENLASGTVSNVLDNVNIAEDDTSTEVSVPITDQDQTAANLAANLDIETPPTTPTPPDDEVPPPGEEDAFFCLAGEVGGFACFESLAECQELATGTEDRCQRFETLPEGADLCRFEDDVLICED